MSAVQFRPWAPFLAPAASKKIQKALINIRNDGFCIHWLPKRFIEIQDWIGVTHRMWREIWTTILSEFSDLPDAAQVTRLTLRLLVAAVLGGLLGYERERQGKSAGVRTHMLVAMGAALFVLIPQQSGISSADLSRVVQGIVAGVGFLGAGAIFMGKKEAETRGLTTAAGIWVTAAVGMAAGMGRESTAVLSTFIALLILSVVPWIYRSRRMNKG